MYTTSTQWHKNSQCSQPTWLIYIIGISLKHLCTFISFKMKNVVLCAIYLYLWFFLLIGMNGVSINYLQLFLMKLESVFSSDIPFVEWRAWFTPAPSKPFMHAVLYLRNIHIYFLELSENEFLHSNEWMYTLATF